MMEPTSLEYALRVAVLRTSLDRRLQTASTSSTAAASVSFQDSPTPDDGPSSFTNSANKGPLSNVQTGSAGLFTFDLGSLRSSTGSRASKFPKETMRIMDGKLKDVAMGLETSDPVFRRSVALFWGQRWSQEMYQRQLKESRKVEDIILPFITMATKVLRESSGRESGQWKEDLNCHISLFIGLISDSLKLTGTPPAELLSRLDDYLARLSQVTPPNAPNQARPIKSVPTEESVGLHPLPNIPKTQSGQMNSKGKSIDAVWKLFGLDSEAMRTELLRIQSICTEQAALEDLKAILQSLNTDNPYPIGKDDFTEPSHWASYRASQISSLSSMMLELMQINPSLVRSSDRNSGSDPPRQADNLLLRGSRSHAAGKSERSPSEDRTFIYIPPDSRATYRDLLSRCLDRDLEALNVLPEDEDVSLGVLSPYHLDLLRECALRWRLGPAYQTWVFLDEIIVRFKLGAVPSACLHEATAKIAEMSMETPVDAWPIRDRDGLLHTIQRRDASLLDVVENAIVTAIDGFLSPSFNESVQDYLSLASDDLVENDRLREISQSISERVRLQAYTFYINEASEAFDAEGGKTRQFSLRMASWMRKTAKKLRTLNTASSWYESYVVRPVLDQQVTLWYRDLQDSLQTTTLVDDSPEMEEDFALYAEAKRVLQMADQRSKQPEACRLETLFIPIVERWLRQTAAKTTQWADTALAVDKFDASESNGPSSSVIDLFDSFDSANRFLMDLRWASDRQMAAFVTALAKAFSLSVQHYCRRIEQLFTEDMILTEEHQPVTAAVKQRLWLEKAKSTLANLQGEKRLTAFFNFTSSSCVKLNNIEVAQKRLDALYEEMRVDDLAAEDIPVPLHTGNINSTQTYIFSVKILLAEGLTVDNPHRGPNPFVIISDENGNRYAKTRTIRDDSDPRWEETFDIPVNRPGGSWFMATVRNRQSLLSNVATKSPQTHDLLGRAYLRLDPGQYANLISKDILLPLDTRGHLLFRVSMEGERDDIQFHFGRAFRCLQRTEADMVRLFVDKMTPVLRQTLSRLSIKTVLKPTASVAAIDYNQALGKITTVYRSAVGQADYSIPMPLSEKTPKRPMTDAEVESAIHPLFDYLDENNATLSAGLSRQAMQKVMSRLWKQVLMIIESLIVPPLGDKPSQLRALGDEELDVALKWLKFLRDFFYAGGADGGVPLEVLQNKRYEQIMSLRVYYDWGTDDLMEECVKGFQTTLQLKANRPQKSLLSQRNLGTIKARKTAKRAARGQAANNTEMIMRILRMRPDTQEFLAQQIEIMSVVKVVDRKPK